MAGAFSSHLLQSHRMDQSMNASIVTSGAMQFSPMMHGTPMPSFSSFGSQTLFGSTAFANESMSEETAMKIAALQVKLNQKLGPEYISQRQGPRGGPKLTYAEGWKIINLANEVFGFNGWSSNLVNLTTDFVDRNESGRYNVGVTAVVRVTLRDGVYHEDVGYGMAENSSSKGQALDKCKKEAVTDGLKRALRNFGNLMGNCLYDKAYTQEVVKMKVPPARFDKSRLHRRPEFAEDTKPPVSLAASAPRPPVPPFSANTSMSSAVASPPTPRQPTPVNGRELLPNVRPLMNAQSSTSVVNPIAPSSNANFSPAQITSNNSNHHIRHLQQQQETSAQGSRGPIPVPVRAAQPVSAKVEPEDSFDFGDDDVFLAALGMEEGDLGRPIETETDIGQPIDHEETFLPPDGDTSIASTALCDTTADVSRSDIPPSDKATRRQRLQQEIINANPTRNDNPLQNPPIEQFTPPEHIRRASVSHLHTDPKPPVLQLLKGIGHQHQARPAQLRRNNRPPSRTLVPNQNENSNPAPSSSDESGGKRPSTLSMGGFHFPSGMNPAQNHNTNLLQGGQGSNGSGIGIKRPANVMSNSATGGSMSGNGLNAGGHRGSRPGMGLQQAAPARREPFAPLDVGESGDVKRVKR